VSHAEPLYLTFHLPGHEPETHEVTGPPGVIRFAVGTPARCSGVWRVWSGRRASDVYVGVRHYTEIQKYSLHETGRWHHAFKDDDTAARYSNLETRFLEKWERPTDAPAGWTLALAVKVPSGSLSDIANPADDDDVLWLPDAPEGRIAVIGIGVVEPDRGTVNVRGLPVAAYRLANGNAVVVMYEQEELTDVVRRNLSAKLSKVPVPRGRDAAEVVEWFETANAPRISLFGNDANGIRFVWDLKVDAATANEAPALSED
jgi:hypothetical protein